ncbi:hypothetical protein FIV42_27690 [Persicimonas caeni]|uniref:Uncharacterized protein n=1 Tax=Persicimonas caeni TaxID=2292766 RepID=A0A4Y6Q1T0_PERCE|nr:hypothetical protein [Persicimonas caeni]QDG54390.1 hypothetical protein FIV42_27690 [Persicimonas caeni]QED35611.1 hypothetical protein FRD00_27685 [Persicimonas caeni]
MGDYETDIEVLLAFESLSKERIEQASNVLREEGFTSSQAPWMMAPDFVKFGDETTFAEACAQGRSGSALAVYVTLVGPLNGTTVKLTLAAYLDDEVLEVSISDKYVCGDTCDPEHGLILLKRFAEVGKAIANVLEPVIAVMTYEELHPDDVSLAHGPTDMCHSYPEASPFTVVEVEAFWAYLEKQWRGGFDWVEAGAMDADTGRRNWLFEPGPKSDDE